MRHIFPLAVLVALPCVAQQAVVSFTLINAKTNQPIPGYDPIPNPLPNPITIDLAHLPTQHLNMRVDTSPTEVGSVQIIVDEEISYTQNVLPYAVFNDVNGIYQSWTPTLGSHSVLAIPFSQPDLMGDIGSALTLKFNVIDSANLKPTASQAVVSYTLINADTNQPILDYDPIQSGAEIDLTTLPTTHLNIRVNTSPTEVGSLRITADGVTYDEHSIPYSVFGQVNGAYLSWTPTGGSHVILATPFTGRHLKGDEGASGWLIFNITE